jgi:hypothetical protein
MQNGTRRASRVFACALILVAGSSCTDSRPTPPTGSTAARVNGSADLNVTDASSTVCGVIAATLIITENTRLSCNVVCTNATGPCIQFGKSNITLWLNGFTMTGPATPPAGCAASPAFGPGNPGPFPFDGISTAGFDHVKVRGPGMVQQFRRHGIFVFESEKAKKGDSWRHERVMLKPANPDFQPIVLTAADEGQLKVVAEFVDVL